MKICDLRKSSIERKFFIYNFTQRPVHIACGEVKMRLMFNLVTNFVNIQKIRCQALVRHELYALLAQVISHRYDCSLNFNPNPLISILRFSKFCFFNHLIFCNQL